MCYFNLFFVLGSYKFLAYLECIRSYAWSCGHSDPDLSSVGPVGHSDMRCTLHLCPGIQEWLRSYCPNIYTVLQQKHVHGFLSHLLLGKVSKNTINCVCQSIRSIYRVLGIYDFAQIKEYSKRFVLCTSICGFFCIKIIKIVCFFKVKIIIHLSKLFHIC